MNNKECQLVKNEITKVLRGKDKEIEMVLCALLAKGHILLEDIPGVGKTTLAVALSKAVSMDYRRMQFTPDVLPSDILGFTMLDPKTQQFVYRSGPIFTNLFLADEINRTSPKTQAALLEVMEEGNVSVEGFTRKVNPPFFVIATQNPVGASGTQKLPDSQLDRFLIRIQLGYPSHEAALEILQGKSSEQMEFVNQVITKEQLLNLQEQTEKIFVHREMMEYMVNLVEMTRKSEYLIQGISPRGSLALMDMAKAHAYMSGREYVVPEDVFHVWYPVGNHRVMLNAKAKAAGETAETILNRIIEHMAIPRLTVTNG